MPVILCGGSGTRLWPLWRAGFPKQFLCLTGKDNLFQQAAQRLARLGDANIHVANPVIVTGEEHRFLAAEHWVVVNGTAEITVSNKVIRLTENQSAYIPLGEVHRLANTGPIPLEIIEVQFGSYLGEDDIVRFEDKYGRRSI